MTYSASVTLGTWIGLIAFYGEATFGVAVGATLVAVASIFDRSKGQ